MLDTGYYSVHRQTWDNWISPINRRTKFTEFEAWEWLIKSACFFCVEQKVGEKFITVPRGYFVCTVEQLAKTWKWDRRTAEKFLKILEEDCMISRFKIEPIMRKSCTLLKVNNYNKFQGDKSDQCTSKCKLKCKLECKLECDLKCTLECTPNNNENNDNNISTTTTPEILLKDLKNIEGVQDVQLFKEEAKNWHGEFCNVHLTEKQYGKLLAIVGSKGKLDELINKLSEKLGAKNPKEIPYDENSPEMHFIRVRQYFDYYRKHPEVWTGKKGQKNNASKNSSSGQSIYEMAKSMANKEQEE